MRLVAAALALTGLGVAVPAAAQALTGEQLRSAFSGQTLSGYNTSGVVFSEYHSPDGRLFGYNNGEPVVDGCWDVKADAVCYYYARSRHPGTFCWRFERSTAAGFRIRNLESSVTGAVRVEPGNPRAYSDAGKPWVCEGLVAGGAFPTLQARSLRLGSGRLALSLRQEDR